MNDAPKGDKRPKPEVAGTGEITPHHASTIIGTLSVEGRAEALRDAYKKHAAELLALEDSQQKLILLLLGVFGAGATFLSSDKQNLIQAPMARLGVSIVTIAILVISGLYTHHRNAARQSIRQLMIACEEALGFFEPGVYRKAAPLYKVEYRDFPKRGEWMGWTFWIAALAGAGFLLVLWAKL